MKEPIVINTEMASGWQWLNKLVTWILPTVIVAIAVIIVNELALEDLIIPLFLLGVACVVFVCLNFTTGMRIADGRLTVVYVRFFMERECSYALREVVLEVRQYEGSYPGMFAAAKLPIGTPPKHYWLQVVMNGELKWHLDSRRGISKEQMVQFVRDFAAARAGY
ncbi:hypothetical protein [Chitinophaga qingshengii]|uniref:DUF3093 family protein n=1 Tax=Chitinophaga qingshengii TaxID=1569794 RepID=A0ABR7TJA8_9BACT|nr:hypothetical protein [Chitinophaga qingshengii]MBC9930063.1 hypothetical protein [Chitinophaga qingshengii]